jgi:uncharacterized RDD family membrane protein YckC
VSELPPDPPNFEPPPPPPPPPGGSGAPGAYGAAPPPPGSGWTGPPLASWGQRAGANLIDYTGPAIVAIVFRFAAPVLGILLSLAALAWGIYNAYLQGETGQSYGKKQLGLRLVRESDGQYIGGGAGIGRFFLHIIDGLPCYLGFLWPLWDAKRQTFADKIMGTLVIVG